MPYLQSSQQKQALSRRNLRPSVVRELWVFYLNRIQKVTLEIVQQIGTFWETLPKVVNLTSCSIS